MSRGREGGNKSLTEQLGHPSPSHDQSEGMSLEIGGNVDIMLPAELRGLQMSQVFKTRTIVIFCLSLAQAGLVIFGNPPGQTRAGCLCRKNERITIFLNFDGQILHAFDALAADRFYLSLASLLFLRFQDGVDVQNLRLDGCFMRKQGIVRQTMPTETLTFILMERP
ncbi:hypothetical protein IW262DRAFT_1486973 [Armillaria fumosa]|nr:hypothetical protein IW262DRAFT_1486973 [Armillaria fumosa]